MVRRIQLKTPSEWLSGWIHRRPSKGEQYCLSCGWKGEPLLESKGRADMELWLWVVFVAVAVIYMIAYGLYDAYPHIRLVRIALKLASLSGKTLFMVSLVYTLFRLATYQWTCGGCHRTELVPADSPRARQALER